MTGFEAMNIAEDLLGVLREEGIEQPTPVQRSAIPVVSEGRDAVIRSHTGTGKTLAYLLPIMNKLDAQLDAVQAVVIAPTQELAMQIVRVAEKLGRPRGIRSLALIGGASLKRQVEKLKLHPQIVAGTPGRLLELLEMRKLKLHQTKMIVADEVDQLFKLGDVSTVERILKAALRDRQIIFVSATIPKQLEEVIDRWMNEPVRIDEAGEERTVSTVEHVYFVCEPRKRTDLAIRLVRHYAPRAALMFVSHTDRIAEVTEKLRFHGIPAGSLYGDQPKLERTVMLDKLQSGELRVLVATDLAARGLDIPHLSHVFSYHPAPDADSYVHRAGRTGRMGRQGTSVTIVTPDERFIMEKFEKQLGIRIARKELYFGRIVDPEKKRIMKETQRRSAQARAPGAKAAKAADVRPKKKSRKQDDKNKGAPRWLKEKMKENM